MRNKLIRYYYLAKRQHHKILEHARIANSFKHITGPKECHLTKRDVAVVCLLKDSSEWINAFIDHYQELGVRQIIILDNGSVDETIELASKKHNVTVYKSTLPFAQYNLALKQYLLKRFTYSCWALLVDVDEFFVFPISNEHTLPRSISYLNNNGFTSVLANMLDMFGYEQRVGMPYHAGKFSRSLYTHYDIKHINYEPYMLRNFTSCQYTNVARGGVRSRMFGLKHITLTKHPLLCGFANPILLDSHFVAPTKLADFSGSLLHYKFAGDFPIRVANAVAEENHYNLSSEYKAYQRVITANPDLRFLEDSSLSFSKSEDLVESKFMYASDRYLNFLASA